MIDNVKIISVSIERPPKKMWAKFNKGTDDEFETEILSIVYTTIEDSYRNMVGDNIPFSSLIIKYITGIDYHEGWINDIHYAGSDTCEPDEIRIGNESDL